MKYKDLLEECLTEFNKSTINATKKEIACFRLGFYAAIEKLYRPEKPVVYFGGSIPMPELKPLINPKNPKR